MEYWKIGSRWNAHGDKKSSILDVFLENNIAFVKEENTGGKMMSEVKVGDIIAISDGLTIVASAEVRTKPDYLKNFPLQLTPGQKEIFDYEEEKDDTVAVSITFRKKEMNVSYRAGAFHKIQDGDVKNQL